MARVAERDTEIAQLHRSVDVEKTGSMVLETRCIAELAKNEDQQDKHDLLLELEDMKLMTIEAKDTKVHTPEARHAELTLLTEKMQQVMVMVRWALRQLRTCAAARSTSSARCK